MLPLQSTLAEMTGMYRMYPDLVSMPPLRISRRFAIFQELERDATDKVQSIFNKIDRELYLDEESSNSNSNLDPFPMSRLPREVKEECDIWRNRFPHLRFDFNDVTVTWHDDAKRTKRKRTLSYNIE